LPLAQMVSGLKTAQAPAPSQTPVVPQVEAGVGWHTPAGSRAPFGRFVQWPGLEARLHERQEPVHALSQQVPWAQKPVEQSAFDEHTEPVFFLPHEPFRQTLGGAQSASDAHVETHPPSLQR
jgi:hypothetical protein